MQYFEPLKNLNENKLYFLSSYNWQKKNISEIKPEQMDTYI